MQEKHDETHSVNHDESLVTMANQIADFFRYQGDADDASRNVARHLSLFWALSMRKDLVARLDRQPDDDSPDPLVRDAVRRFRQELTRYGGKVPGEQALQEPQGGGDAG